MTNIKHYLSLMAILSIGFGVFWLFNFNRQAQIIMAITLGVVYFLWGIAYHLVRQEITSRLVIEYFVISLAAILLIISLLLRA